MLRKIVAAVVVLVVALVALVATRPGTFRVERSLVIEESPRVIFKAVADLRQWSAWSPWAKLDPGQKSTFEGEPAKVGSSHAWAGNEKVGAGRMTVTAIHPPTEVTMKLEFLEPWRSTSETVFQLHREARGTRVTWIMRGDLDFMGKAMSLVKSMDRIVGPDFERGLANLKALVEDDSAPR